MERKRRKELELMTTLKAWNKDESLNDLRDTSPHLKRDLSGRAQVDEPFLCSINNMATKFSRWEHAAK
ncbi:hypothetical protein Scep_021827 [Stephania cephalantha]|uniref:Uncharacterized protein n=1 Tax=Stephania cephalantha TaxID=152367 RepID=A0AAP0HX64_9MAGN